MKAVILAGGYGTRLAEETDLMPKPMVKIGEKPIIWHIMKIYSHYGINDFVICLGYKGYVIKEYFENYFLHMSDVTIDVRHGKMEVHNKKSEPWKITLVDTGSSTMTGARVKLVQPYIGDETFCLTYGDGVADINIKELIKYHNNHDKLATVTAVQPRARFGALDIKEDHIVKGFIEKPKESASWINGGYFVMDSGIFNYLDDRNDLVLEREPLEKLSKDGELMAFKHNGFWQPMDTLREKTELNGLWESAHCPWRVW
ncbi:MAG: glucose-1-phosphate cytidylyltransferase [Bacteroidales bacterium]|nr:glucose-1-phosphate cytidylyltransferase [Bacteroidales bacterium]